MSSITNNKLLALTASILMIASVASIGSFMNADASHGKRIHYEDGNITFYCENSMNHLSVESHLRACTEVSKGLGIWTKKVYGVTLSSDSSNYEIRIKSGFPVTKGIAENQNSYGGGHIVSSKITFSLNEKFGDGSWFDSHYGIYDLQSVALHESGHSLGLNHDESSSVMKDSADPGVKARNPSSHDIAVLEGYY